MSICFLSGEILLVSPKIQNFAEKIGYEMIITQGDKQNIAGYMDIGDLVLAKVMTKNCRI